ncbi:SDR family oxidoreductase [Neolewinella agarilytica]|uniref:NADP-dependent 3-hydroxy acid dehydrogenase YdfG n=1 Tax=Neolewinella agarilytica TaxID=478744 RepID=A0A1H9CUM5_9BACT|nr:SDR family oxidoreductase [Neolewinella agarilytica]SEQ04787.1 NADP-dependent 3-hydroxy acid dehydrogenase YdfG [Neolewinella agarilytica]
MLTITLAYTSENQSTAHRLTGDLSSHVNFEHVVVGKANEGPVLADLLEPVETPVLVLISDDFLTNPNCMLRGRKIFDGQRETLPVFIRSHSYDAAADEVISRQTSLANQAEVMHYVNHWQDRYIDLRREAEELTAQGGESFKQYLKKIRETSTQAEELLHSLKDSWSLTEAQFAANHYHQLFIFAERPALWEEFKTFEEAPPIDVSDIPGLSMLGAGAPVQGEVEEQSLVSEAQTPPPMDDNDGPEPPKEKVAPMQGMDDQAGIWIERAWALFDDGDAASGLELLNAGREALPDQLSLHYHYALLLATTTGEATAAQREIEALLDKSPDHPDALFLNGELHEAGGRFQKARDNWENLSDVEPFYPDLNYRLGVLLADHFPEDYLDAAAYLRRATKAKEASGDAFYRYAVLLAGPVERRKKAIKQLKKAIEISPSHAAAHYQLAVLLHGQGELVGAQNAFKTAVGLDRAYDTPVNRQAFASAPAAVEMPEVVVAGTPAEEDALASLKKSIADLEAMIKDRDAAAAESSPAPASSPKIGSGKTVFISGATAGIGRATARALAEDGYRLILLGRRRERLSELEAELHEKHGVETYLLSIDVRDRDGLTAAIASLPEAWSTIDVLINNAGKAKGVDPIHEGSLDHWDEMIDVNLKGLLYLTRAITPGMVARKSGMVINVASTAGKEVYPNGNVYCATKHGVDALTRAMRLDLVKHGIRIGQVAPAMVEETEFSLVRYDGDAERAKIYGDFQPLRSPDVAESIRFMINQPRHVNILDIVLQGTQQASSTVVDRSGRERFAPEEE